MSTLKIAAAQFEFRIPVFAGLMARGEDGNIYNSYLTFPPAPDTRLISSGTAGLSRSLCFCSAARRPDIVAAMRGQLERRIASCARSACGEDYTRAAG